MPQIVLQKVIADAGVASRRASEELISSGKVKVNNNTVTKLGTRVDPKKDTVELNGKILDRPQELVYFLLNKPKGIVSTANDEQGRRTVIDLIDTEKRIVPVGRLDMYTTGLLILTNDGDLVNKLTHPRFEHEKEYEAIIQVPQDWKKENLDHALSKMSKGVKIANDFRTSLSKARVLSQVSSDRYTISVVIHEGKNHQVRQMIDAAGLSVVELKRIRSGPIAIGDLKQDAYRELTDQEVSELKKDAG
jgi:23S rRNA pseudouridine2605 synthase